MNQAVRALGRRKFAFNAKLPARSTFPKRIGVIQV